MMTYEGFRLEILKFWRVGLAKYRKSLLDCKDFTIISNNCWGGMIYESYNLPKKSPTIGLFFMAKDYIEFLSDLKGYINGTLTFISPTKSRWKNIPQVYEDKNWGKYPIGELTNGKNTIEVFFLHYNNEKEAKEKWNRRIKRINWDKLLIKFNDQNGCSESDLNSYIKLPYKNKLFFTSKKWQIPESEYIRINQFPKCDHIKTSYEPFGKNKYIDVTYIINHL